MLKVKVVVEVDKEKLNELQNESNNHRPEHKKGNGKRIVF